MTATAKERAIEAELLTDPAYKALWDAFKVAFAALEPNSPPDAGPVTVRVAKAARAIYKLLDRRPDLVALVELAESADH